MSYLHRLLTGHLIPPLVLLVYRVSVGSTHDFSSPPVGHRPLTDRLVLSASRVHANPSPPHLPPPPNLYERLRTRWVPEDHGVITCTDVYEDEGSTEGTFCIDETLTRVRMGADDRRRRTLLRLRSVSSGTKPSAVVSVRVRSERPKRSETDRPRRNQTKPDRRRVGTGFGRSSEGLLHDPLLPGKCLHVTESQTLYCTTRSLFFLGRVLNRRVGDGGADSTSTRSGDRGRRRAR